MAAVNQALSELKELYSQCVGQPAPEIPPRSFAPFPPGVDPVEHALGEVRFVRQLAEQIKVAPAPVTWAPRADSFTTREAIVVRVEIPGVPKDHVKVFVAGAECIVRGERPLPSGAEGMRALNLEWPYGPFERRFALPPGFRAESLAARFAEGILELRFPVEASVASAKELNVEIA